MEVKLSLVVRGDDVRHLLWLRERAVPALLDVAVLTTGRAAYRRHDGVERIVYVGDVAPTGPVPSSCEAGSRSERHCQAAPSRRSNCAPA